MMEPSSVSYLHVGSPALNLPLKSRRPSCGQAEQGLWKVTRCFQDKPQAAVAVSGPPGLCLKVLVDLGHILHDALPVRPVCVQHLTELLQQKGRGHGGTPQAPLPQRG